MKVLGEVLAAVAALIAITIFLSGRDHLRELISDISIVGKSEPPISSYCQVPCLRWDTKSWFSSPTLYWFNGDGESEVWEKFVGNRITKANVSTNKKRFILAEPNEIHIFLADSKSHSAISLWSTAFSVAPEDISWISDRHLLVKVRTHALGYLLDNRFWIVMKPFSFIPSDPGRTKIEVENTTGLIELQIDSFGNVVDVIDRT